MMINYYFGIKLCFYYFINIITITIYITKTISFFFQDSVLLLARNGALERIRHPSSIQRPNNVIIYGALLGLIVAIGANYAGLF